MSIAIMASRLLALLIGGAYLAAACPLALVRRGVQELDQAAFAEAQERDETATRAFSSTQIRTQDGKCLAVDPLSGDFRANLTPVQVAGCNGTEGQSWDIIIEGKHNSQTDSMLVVNTLTQACLNFDPRRAAGSQVNLFSCGGRADGGGEESDSQIFDFAGAMPLQLQLKTTSGICLTAKGNILDQAACSSANATQCFTFR